MAVDQLTQRLAAHGRPFPAPAGRRSNAGNNQSGDYKMDRYDLTDEELTEAKAIILAEASNDGINDPDFDL